MKIGTMAKGDANCGSRVASCLSTKEHAKEIKFWKEVVVVAKMQIREEGTHGRNAVARKGAKEKRKVNRTHSSVVSKGRQHKFVRR